MAGIDTGDVIQTFEANHGYHGDVYAEGAIHFYFKVYYCRITSYKMLHVSVSDRIYRLNNWRVHMTCNSQDVLTSLNDREILEFPRNCGDLRENLRSALRICYAFLPWPFVGYVWEVFGLWFTLSQRAGVLVWRNNAGAQRRFGNCLTLQRLTGIHM